MFKLSIKSLFATNSKLFWPGISTNPLMTMVENRDFLFVKHTKSLFSTNFTHPGGKTTRYWICWAALVKTRLIFDHRLEKDFFQFDSQSIIFQRYQPIKIEPGSNIFDMIMKALTAYSQSFNTASDSKLQYITGNNRHVSRNLVSKLLPTLILP